jgi:hypothetical protein
MQSTTPKIIPENFPIYIPKHQPNPKFKKDKVSDVTSLYFMQKKIEEEYLISIINYKNNQINPKQTTHDANKESL